MFNLGKVPFWQKNYKIHIFSDHFKRHFMYLFCYLHISILVLLYCTITCIKHTLQNSLLAKAVVATWIIMGMPIPCPTLLDPKLICTPNINLARSQKKTSCRKWPKPYWKKTAWPNFTKIWIWPKATVYFLRRFVWAHQLCWFGMW